MSYVDFCIRPRGLDEANRIAAMLARLGVAVAGVEGERPLLKPFIDHGVEVYHRVTLRPPSASRAVEMLREARGRYDIVALQPSDVETARLAARDERVDIVHLPPSMAKYMDRSQALLLRMGGGVVEVGLSRIVRLGHRQLRGFMIIVRRAYAYEAPLVVSSCASTEWELWHPRHVIGLLVSSGVPEKLAKTAVTGSTLLGRLRVLRGGGRGE